jgi:hypothetical protein
LLSEVDGGVGVLGFGNLDRTFSGKSRIRPVAAKLLWMFDKDIEHLKTEGKIYRKSSFLIKKIPFSIIFAVCLL